MNDSHIEAFSDFVTALVAKDNLYAMMDAKEPSVPITNTETFLYVLSNGLIRAQEKLSEQELNGTATISGVEVRLVDPTDIPKELWSW